MNKERLLELTEAAVEAVAQLRHGRRGSLKCQGRGLRLQAIKLPLTFPQLRIIKVGKGFCLSHIRNAAPGGCGGQ
jgi:hypothetical protein